MIRVKSQIPRLIYKHYKRNAKSNKVLIWMINSQHKTPRKLDMLVAAMCFFRFSKRC